VSEALDLRDAEQNGIELYWDRPTDQLPRTPEGGINMFTNPLDLDDLLPADIRSR
jgi:catechol 2,3-dioxygenase